jgi:hypothetical protein
MEFLAAALKAIAGAIPKAIGWAAGIILGRRIVVIVPIANEMRYYRGASIDQVPAMQLTGMWHLTPVKPPGVKIVTAYVKRFRPRFVPWFPFLAMFQITHAKMLRYGLDSDGPTGWLELIFLVPHPVTSEHRFVVRVVLVDNLGHSHTFRTVFPVWPPKVGT